MSTTPTKPGLFERILRFLANLLLAVLLGLALGAALFFGVPAVYREFVQPVRDHTVQIRLLEADQAALATQAAGQIFDLTARLETIEEQSDANKAAAADLKALQTAAATAESGLTALQTASADQLAAIATLQAGQQKAQASIDNSKQILIDSIGSLDARLNALETAQAASATNQALADQVGLLRAMQLVLRAQFYLAQNNFGLAGQDIQVSLGLLKELALTLPAGQAAMADEAAGYLESAALDLPDRPVIANAKLDAAWQVLLGYAPTPTPTPLATLTPTPTPSATLAAGLPTGMTATPTPVK